jgi:hypothetical protein
MGVQRARPTYRSFSDTTARERASAREDDPVNKLRDMINRLPKLSGPREVCAAATESAIALGLHE